METTAASDSELLTAWVTNRRESAFHALVARYATLVHMVAKRTCGDDALAADASQLVFIILAQKAKSLTTHPTLAGWLHVTAVMKTRDLIDKARRESRKRQHFSAEMETHNPSHSIDAWQEMQPVLDDALAALSANDHEAILLRFYRSLTIREIGETLGIATDAAQKRIARATERLRGKLAKRGCQAGGTLAATMLAGFAADASAAVPAVSILATKAIAAVAVGPGAGVITFITTFAMKSTSLIPPAIALILAGMWVGTQRQSISSLESKIDTLETNLALYTATPVAVVSKQTSPFPHKPIDWTLPIDWKEIIARRLSPDERANLIKRLQSMTAEELATEIDKIASIGLSDEENGGWQQTVFQPLVQKDPELALRRFSGRLNGIFAWLSFPLSEALHEWAKREPGKAVAWFDQQTADGKFDSRGLNETRLFDMFQGAVIGVLLSTNPDDAAVRFSQVSEGRRFDFLRLNTMRWMEEGTQTAYAKLVREGMLEKDQRNALACLAYELVDDDGLSKVSGNYSGALAPT